MKISRENRGTTSFNTLTPGEVFEFKGETYIAMGGMPTDINAVCLSDGRPALFLAIDQVIVLNAELIIH